MDIEGDLTEDYIAGVPAPENVALSDLHGVIGAGLLNVKKPVGDSDSKTVPLPLIIIIYKDRAYWNHGGNGVRLLQSGDHATMTTSELSLSPLRPCENNCSCKLVVAEL